MNFGFADIGLLLISFIGVKMTSCSFCGKTGRFFGLRVGLEEDGLYFTPKKYLIVLALGLVGSMIPLAVRSMIFFLWILLSWISSSCWSTFPFVMIVTLLGSNSPSAQLLRFLLLWYEGSYKVLGIVGLASSFPPRLDKKENVLYLVPETGFLVISTLTFSTKLLQNYLVGLCRLRSCNQ